jgi:hypothetical protein
VLEQISRFGLLATIDSTAPYLFSDRLCSCSIAKRWHSTEGHFRRYLAIGPCHGPSPPFLQRQFTAPSNLTLEDRLREGSCLCQIPFVFLILFSSDKFYLASTTSSRAKCA